VTMSMAIPQEDTLMAAALSSAKGDLFWDMFPYVYYIPGSEMFCSIFVVNPGDEDREYLLMARVSSSETVISEDALKVNGNAWFAVDAEEKVSLQGCLVLEESDVTLDILLYEKESGEVVDQVTTHLVEPKPIADANQLLAAVLPMLLLGSLGSMAGGVID